MRHDPYFDPQADMYLAKGMMGRAASNFSRATDLDTALNSFAEMAQCFYDAGYEGVSARAAEEALKIAYGDDPCGIYFLHLWNDGRNDRNVGRLKQILDGRVFETPIMHVRKERVVIRRQKSWLERVFG